jgi:hypothetical protein
MDVEAGFIILNLKNGLVTRLVAVNLDWPPMGDKSA